MWNFHFLELETRGRIAELRRLAERDRLAVLAEVRRSRYRRLAVGARLSALLRFDALRQAASFFPRRGAPSGGR